MTIHILVLVVAGSMTLFRLNGITYSPSYTVDLVTLPGPPSPPTPKVSAPAPSPPPAAKAEKPEPPVQKPEKPKPSAEKPEPKTAAQASPVPAKPLEKIQPIKPSGGDEAARVERRKQIEELEQEARRLYESFTADKGGLSGPVEQNHVQPEKGAPQPAAGTGSPGPSAGQAGKVNDLRFRQYYDQIWGLIRSSWVLPEGVITEDKLLTKVGIRIAPDGEILKYQIEQSSGNEYYDQSAIRAIRKSNPLPPLPKGLADEPFDVGINFRYPE